MSDFKQLISTIEQVHQYLQDKAVSAVNQALTIRNWMIGHYIVEFEQNGKDKAEYGANLLEKLAESLSHIKGISDRSLRKFRQFYHTYPDMHTAFTESSIRWSPTTELEIRKKWGSMTTELPEQKLPLLKVSPQKLIAKLSYTHFELLINIDDPWIQTFLYNNT